MKNLAAVLSASGDDYRTVVVVAHPDDEVIGLGSRLHTLRQAWFVHVTDGAPPNGKDATRHGFSSLAEYAETRRHELREALAMVGVESSRAICVGIADQTATKRMAEIALWLRARFEQFRPDIVFTHPYEGGHPDHDATAFAVHAACELDSLAGRCPPKLVEMGSYHLGESGMTVGEFLDCGETNRAHAAFVLSEQEKAFKQSLLDCFRSQRETLSQFTPGTEKFREAPRYDFTLSPHPGRLLYESFDWGMTGTRFRAYAARALGELGLSGSI